MDGYDGAHEDTANAFDNDGWLDTGDLGYLADGRLYVTGRNKDLIIVNGRNILPQDLEWYAEQNVDELRSRETAAFGVLGETGRERVVMLVQARFADPARRERLRKLVHSAVFRNAGVDCDVVLVPPRSLPFTSSGKLSRVRARELYLGGAFDAPDLPKAAADA
jgi:fatty-acyl-CoA synthase